MAFRTGRTLAEHSQDLRDIKAQQRTAFGNIDPLADAIGAPGDRSLTQHLDSIEGELGDAKRLLRALTRAQGVARR